MLRSDMCDSSGAYIAIKEIINVTNPATDAYEKN